MAVSTMSTQFSKDGKYFAQIASDGKIKIWETATSAFKQEFTPNLHLQSPCTCLHWIQGKSQTPHSKTPRKKLKHRQSDYSDPADNSKPLLALGTSSGALLLYSVASAEVETTVDGNTSHAISCITWQHAQEVYVGAEQFVLLFDLKAKSVKSKWRTGNDTVHAILLVPNKPRLLTAARTIKLWDTVTQENLKTFTGHSSDVVHLCFIPSDNADPYFVSGSKADRLLSCWSLNEKSREKDAVATLLMEDIAVCVSLVVSADNATSLAAVTRSGVVHIYQHTLNGTCGKPVKPKVTIQVANDTGQSKELVTPIPILAAYFLADSSVMIAHGNNVVLTFENVMPRSYEKVQCLIRKDPRVTQSNQDHVDEITRCKRPLVDSRTVDYLTPHTANNYKAKRKSGLKVSTEVPMEQRLENLTLRRADGSTDAVTSTLGVPRQDNVAQLLVQGLHSKDRTILQSVLSKRDEHVIRNTVRRLPMAVIVPLLTELTGLIQGKTLACQTGVIWLRYLVQLHASQLISNPQLVDLIGPVLGSVENRLSLLAPLSRLRGRLDLLVTQITDTSREDMDTEQALLVYKDQGSSDSDSDENIELNLHSDSEQEWVEEEDEEDSGNDSNTGDLKIDGNHVSDSEMSM